MNKKIVAILIALIGSASIGTIAVAQTVSREMIPPYHYYREPKVMLAEGVAFDKEKNESKQVIFLVMKYGEERHNYLIVGEEVYKLEKIESYKLGPGTKVIKYKGEDGSILTILIQRFGWRIAISGDFKNYLMVFKPMHYYSKPIYEIKRTQEIKPLMEKIREIGEKEGMNLTWLEEKAGPVKEWIS